MRFPAFPGAFPRLVISAAAALLLLMGCSNTTSSTGADAKVVLDGAQVDSEFRQIDSRWDEENTVPVRVLVGPARKVTANLVTLPDSFEKTEPTEEDLARGPQGQLIVAKWSGPSSSGGSCAVRLIRVPSALVEGGESRVEVAGDEAAVEVSVACRPPERDEKDGNGGKGGKEQGGV
ncbi:MAG: hypothetical protein WD004_06260 [Actinomycetota bacterium]